MMQAVVGKIQQAAGALATPLPDSHPNILTTIHGAPIPENKNSLTAGAQGPVLLQDTVLLEKIAQFARERTPPRNVHALGFGGFGKFTVTHDITRYSSAALFSKVGNTCETFTRFSGVFTERGDADLLRDLRGFATKFYTTDGNWDMLAVNTPCFNVRDMKLGPDTVHAFKRDPRTGEWNGNQTWDYVATHPEGLQTQLMVWTDRVGTPKSFRMQHWFPTNTFSMINDKKERFWVRFHMVSQQGWEGMTRDEAALIAGTDSNFLAREMREAVENGMHPKWKMHIQVMTEAEGYSHPFTFDCTKVWKHDDFPLIEIGELVVDRWPQNYHTTTETVAFSPARLIPGIGPSPDKLLQGRILLYDLTQAHRLGSNYAQIPINCPFASKVNNYWSFQGQAPGADQFDKNVFPQYYPSVFGNNWEPDTTKKEPMLSMGGNASYYPTIHEYSDEDIYAQPRDFLKVLPANEMVNLVDNLGYTLSGVDPRVVTAIMDHFTKINPDFSSKVTTAISKHKTHETVGKKAANDIRAALHNPSSFIEKTQQAH